MKKFPGEIQSKTLNVDNLNDLDDYDHIIIISRIINNKILIEDEFMCARRISFLDLENEIGCCNIGGLIYLIDDIPELSNLQALELPTLLIQNNELARFCFKLFQKPTEKNLDNYSYFINKDKFILSTPISKVKTPKTSTRKSTPLPIEIDSKIVKDFIGRIAELQSISRKIISLEDEQGILSIKGSGGIGKTTMLKKITVELANRNFFNDGIHFIDCEPISDGSQLTNLIASLFNLEQAEGFQESLMSHTEYKSKLIIFDNFETLLHLEDVDEIKVLIASICNYASIVVTTREYLDIPGEIPFNVGQFITDEAVQLFMLNIGKVELSDKDTLLLRTDIIENLLDNNPLAIKLVTANMPKGKDLLALKNDLENDIFSNIDTECLSSFDSSSDININRKKSIYGSILYSYKSLNPQEEKAFELLSLFPDGIYFEHFKKILFDIKNKNVRSELITDKNIRALENKSMIENVNGHIKLQSIVGKFAHVKLSLRENLVPIYNNVFNYNYSMQQSLSDIDEKKFDVLYFFSTMQNNIIKTISLLKHITVEDNDICDFLYSISDNLISTGMLKVAIPTLKKQIPFFEGRIKEFLEIHILYFCYFNGDFKNVFKELTEQYPIDYITSLDTSNLIEELIYICAAGIYSMEGFEHTISVKRSKVNKQYKLYTTGLHHTGTLNSNFMLKLKPSFTLFEIQLQLEVLKTKEIDDFIANIFEKDHLEKVQISYTRSKLEPLTSETINTLITINPYTRGLKLLMLAFVERNINDAIQLYEQALPNLVHIKFYYVEALYLYSLFLQKNELELFDEIYSEGLELSKKHKYRFYQYNFEKIITPTDRKFDIKDYISPEDECFYNH